MTKKRAQLEIAPVFKGARLGVEHFGSCSFPPRRGLTVALAVLELSCRLGWPSTHTDLPASAF